mmetsp:Transcript_43888/g.72493  ORF Transcript_43888/g.72493 Transcript_43888/m.72493 type:complete len:164 (-) Transcript_43888:221-712(-)
MDWIHWTLVTAVLLQLCSFCSAQIDCTCTSETNNWQCTFEDGTTVDGTDFNFKTCVDERDDLWESTVDCKFCYKCTGSAGIGTCECDTSGNCNSTYYIIGIVFVVVGIIFMIWQGIILFRFFAADGEWKDVWKVCGCFIIGLVLLIIGIILLASPDTFYGVFS